MNPISYDVIELVNTKDRYGFWLRAISKVILGLLIISIIIGFCLGLIAGSLLWG